MYRLSGPAALFATGVLSACVQACAMPPSTVTVKELTAAATTASRQPIRLPQGDVRIVLSNYLIPAGVTLPEHKHLHTRLALVQAGNLAVTNIETGETVNYGPGDMIVESVDQWHFGVNTGTSPVHLLVLDALPIGVSSNMVPRSVPQ